MFELEFDSELEPSGAQTRVRAWFELYPYSQYIHDTIHT